MKLHWFQALWSWLCTSNCNHVTHPVLTDSSEREKNEPRSSWAKALCFALSEDFLYSHGHPKPTSAGWTHTHTMWQNLSAPVSTEGDIDFQLTLNSFLTSTLIQLPIEWLQHLHLAMRKHFWQSIKASQKPCQRRAVNILRQGTDSSGYSTVNTPGDLGKATFV